MNSSSVNSEQETPGFFIEPGTVIGAHYEIIEPIGCGGMGTVYKARQPELNRLVALKVLHPRFATDEDFIKRFMREARATSSVRHQNIISIFALGMSEYGPYMVLEYVPGSSLSHLILARGRIPLEECVPIFKQIGAALSHAHCLDIIHRDLKPDNVMLQYEPSGVVAKVLDFGLAKAIGTGQTVQNLTSTGQVLGDPIYMSPEQCRGLELDAKSDIYSLGCLMYECLTGFPPFMADTAVATMFKRIDEDPEPFAERLGLPSAIEDIVFTCMAPSPHDRYDDAGEVVTQLDAALNGTYKKRPKRAARSLTSAQKTLARKRILLSITAVCLVALVGLAVLYTSQQRTKSAEVEMSREMLAQCETILSGAIDKDRLPEMRERLKRAYETAQTEGNINVQAKAAYALGMLSCRIDPPSVGSWMKIAEAAARQTDNLVLANECAARRIRVLYARQKYGQAIDEITQYEMRYRKLDPHLQFIDPRVELAFCDLRLHKYLDGLASIERARTAGPPMGFQDPGPLRLALMVRSGNPGALSFAKAMVAVAHSDVERCEKASVASRIFATSGQVNNAKEMLAIAKPVADFMSCAYSHAEATLAIAEATGKEDWPKAAESYQDLLKFYQSRIGRDLNEIELNNVFRGYEEVAVKLKISSKPFKEKFTAVADLKKNDRLIDTYMY